LTAHTYSILRVPPRKEFASISTYPDEMEDPWLLSEGASYAALFPAGLAAEMDTDHKGSKLADFVENSMQWLIVSERVRELLGKEPAQLEVFPLGILDKKGKRVEKPYFLAHLLGTVDCVDLEKSIFVRSSFKPAQVHTFNKLVLDPARIPSDATLFRIKEQPRTKIIRADLVERLRAAGIDGFDLWELNAPIVL
jgi:hypothetical protein